MMLGDRGRITVGATQSCYQPRDGSAGQCLANAMTLRMAGGVKTIIAVGLVATAGSAYALPPDAVEFDLVDLARTNPPLAGELWGEFLRHLWYSGKPSFWRRQCMGSAPRLVAVPVVVQLDCARARTQVCKAINASIWRACFRLERAS